MKPGPNTFSPQARKYRVEKRDPETGALDRTFPQPPFVEATDAEICRFYVRNNPGRNTPESRQVIAEWYEKQGWFWRPKGW